MSTPRMLLAATALLSFAALSGCPDDNLFTDCPLSNSIAAACEDVGGGVDFNCVVAEHPYCLEEICASWQGSESFCTRSCVIDDDCPGTSTCESHLQLDFCVPAESE